MHLLRGLLLLLSLAGTNLSQPRMQLFPSAGAELATGSATLICSVDGFSPKDLEVEWRRDGQRQEQGVRTEVVTSGKNQSYVISSQLTVPAREWQKRHTYSCVVRHEALPRAREGAVSAKDPTAE